jgi:hypothetical protein
MLPLTDPLWEKLDAASNKDIPKLLSQLAETWDNDKAHSLLWNDLWQQDHCYGATFAAVPHLLRLAEPAENRQQRSEIALFLGYLAALCTPEQGHPPPTLHELPDTLEGWDRRRDDFRRFVASFEDPLNAAHERPELPVYKRILALDPVNAADLEKIKSIRDEFFAALPAIGVLCERALLESVEDGSVVETCLLSGIAATEGLLNLAWLLHHAAVYGGEFMLRCAACGYSYHYVLHGDRIAIYAYRESESQADYDTRQMLDWEEKSPSRADGFIVPVAHGEISDVRAMRLLALADRSASAEPGLLLRNFLGHIQCCKCGARTAIRAV